MNRLAEIIAHKRTEIEPLIGYTTEWREKFRQVLSFRSFRRSLTADSFGIIAEVKKASPSAGVISEDVNPVKVALAYDEAGANCISVLTDQKYFHGHLSDLAAIRKTVNRPLLRKDFIVHEVQIYQAALAGADAILLIVAALTHKELDHFLSVSDGCGIDALVEVHNEPELSRALSAGAIFIGINNRNLTTFRVDLRTTEALAPLIPKDRVVISESGIKSVEDIRRVAAAGVHGALIGESLMRAANPQAVLKSFRAAAVQTQKLNQVLRLETMDYRRTLQELKHNPEPKT
jgi:indole-3-glycerol phosphate synthase